MSVTIGEFEVVAPPPETQAPSPAPASAQTPPDPLELQRLLDLLHELRLRVWPH
jgi:hypothetical protein